MGSYITNGQKVTYISNKPKHKDINDYIYLDLEILGMADELGAEQTIQYLEDKIKLIQQTYK